MYLSNGPEIGLKTVLCSWFATKGDISTAGVESKDMKNHDSTGVINLVPFRTLKSRPSKSSCHGRGMNIFANRSVGIRQIGMSSLKTIFLSISILVEIRGEKMNQLGVTRVSRKAI